MGKKSGISGPAALWRKHCYFYYVFFYCSNPLTLFGKSFANTDLSMKIVLLPHGVWFPYSGRIECKRENGEMVSSEDV